MPNPKDRQYSHIFDTSQINRDVNRKSVKAGAANLTSQGLSLGITLIRAAILARLLTPEDYGVFSMVVVVSSFAVIFKDLGLSTATIREKEITHAQVSNLFWINVTIGFLSMLVIWAAAPVMVWFYHDSRLTPVAWLLSVSFLFGGFTVQHQALLRRQMRFGKIAIITVSSSVISSLLGIIVAWSQGNYWALVWMQVMQSFLVMVGCWFASGWLPGLPSAKAGTKKFIKIGLDVAGLNAFSTLTQSIDKVIVGRIAGATSLGLYSKGGQVPNLVSGQFRMAFFSVALPALSSLQSEKKRFSTYYYRFLSSICWVTMPLSVFCLIYAEEIINVYFGSQWTGAIPFMRIFSIHAFLMPAITSLDQIPLVLGLSRRYLAGGIIRSLGTIICVSAGAMLYGVKGLAFGVVLANIVTFFPFCKICLKNSPIGLGKYLQTALVPLLSSILIGLIFILIKSFYPAHTLSSQLCIMICCMVSFSIVFLICDYFDIGCSLGAVNKILNKLRR